MRAAQQRPLAGAQAWDPKVAVDQGPLVAATLALWAFLAVGGALPAVRVGSLGAAEPQVRGGITPFASRERLDGPPAAATTRRETSMRLSACLLLLSLAGVLGGAALIGLPALGVAVIADSVAVGVYALLRDDGSRGGAGACTRCRPTLENILEKARRAG